MIMTVQKSNIPISRTNKGIKDKYKAKLNIKCKIRHYQARYRTGAVIGLITNLK